MQGLNERDGFEVLKKPCGKSEQSRLFTLGLAVDLVEARVQAGLATFFAELFSPFVKQCRGSGRLPRACRQSGPACLDDGLASPDGLSWRFERDGRELDAVALTESDLLFLVMLSDVLPTFTEMSEDVASNYVLRLTRDAFEDFEDFDEGALDRVLEQFSQTTLVLRDEREAHEERLTVLSCVRGKGSRLELEVDPLALVSHVGIAADAAFAEWLNLWDARGGAPSKGTLVLLAVLVSLMPLDEEDEDEMELSAREICALLGSSGEHMADVPLERLCREIALLPGWSLESFEEIAEDSAYFEKGEIVWKIRRSLVE